MRKILSAMAAVALAIGASAQKYVGGDISLLPVNEAAGPTWKDRSGNAVSSPLELFRQEGMNAMRVRLFVSPEKYAGSDKDANACQDIEYVKTLGRRVKDAGFKLMLDFHYSDTWADPAKQWTPAEWAALGDEQLYQKIYGYTKDALMQMKAAGAEPDFIQTGNEISYGMLWGPYGTAAPKKCYSGSAANWERFTTLLRNAAKVCREVCPDAKIILHTERVAQPSVLTGFYNRMKGASVDYDIIGLSYYPVWHKDLATLETALNTLEKTFADKDIMIVETGYCYSWYPEGGDYDYRNTYPATEEGQANYTRDLIAVLNRHDRVTGLFWWWMEYNAYPWAVTHMDGWWYAPLFNSNTGNALPALSLMKDFLSGQTGIKSVNAVNGDKHRSLYTIDGRQVGGTSSDGNHPRGIYIKNGKKAVKSRTW